MVLNSTPQELQNIIMRSINEGIWEPGERIPSERQLAQSYNVSRTVVRKAIASLIEKGVLIAVPGSGTYVSTTPEKPTNSKTLAFLVCSRGKPDYTVTTNLFYAQVLRGVELTARRMGYQLIVSTIDELSRDFGSLDEIMAKADGLILGELRCQRLHDHIMRKRYPTALISPSLSSPYLDTVKIDSYSGSVAAVDYLASLGHKKIAFIGGSKNSLPAQERLEGYKAGLRKNDLEVTEGLIRISGWDFENARQAGCDLLEQEEFTAVLAASDYLAFAALQVLREHNYRVPDDISVIGFDDLEVSAQQSPPLTSVRVHKEHLGKLAVNMLLARLEDNRDFGTITNVPSELIKRASCRPANSR